MDFFFIYPHLDNSPFAITELKIHCCAIRD